MSDQIKAGLGVDLGLPSVQVRDFVSENVALIKSIPNQYFDDVEKLLTRAVSQGSPWRSIASEIEDRYQVAESRARLIARDQIGKFYSKVNEVRQKEIGADAYFWRTMNDNRVRDEHQEREGERFTWDDPPEDGHPGEAIQCRCYAEPDLSELLSAEEEEVSPTAFESEPTSVEAESEAVPTDVETETSFLPETPSFVEPESVSLAPDVMAEAPKVSTQVDWDLKHKEFASEGLPQGVYSFDVLQAKKLLAKTPLPVVPIDPKDFIEKIAKEGEKPVANKIFIDWQKVKTGIPSEELGSTAQPIQFKTPVLIAEIPEGPYKGELYIFDGRHRLARAAIEGLDEIPGIVIPKKLFKKYADWVPF